MKETKPPNQFTEASLLRAMETAGKQVDNEKLRDLMKENGIGRPSTRANIIETLFKRKYIKRNKKQVLPTLTGIQLIETIQNELLKSAELTGRWEKQLKDIEKGEFSASAFIRNMKRMVDALVYEVRREAKQANISHSASHKQQKAKKSKKAELGILSEACPKCKIGRLLKGKTAYGCSEYQQGCGFVLPFKFSEKKISERQYIRLLRKGTTVNLKGFKTNSGKVDGVLILDDHFKLQINPKDKHQDINLCPKCKKGNIIKGKTAFGCSNYKVGCGFKVPFETVKAQLNGEKPSLELVYEVLRRSCNEA